MTISIVINNVSYNIYIYIIIYIINPIIMQGRFKLKMEYRFSPGLKSHKSIKEKREDKKVKIIVIEPIIYKNLRLMIHNNEKKCKIIFRVFLPVLVILISSSTG